jgi:hypothetical protein
MTKILIGALFALAATASAQYQGRKVLIAHRGASAYAPENTLPAFELAIQQGADYLENDLQVTRDVERCRNNSHLGTHDGESQPHRCTLLGCLTACAFRNRR